MDKARQRALEYLPEIRREDYDCEEDWIDAEVRNRSDRILYMSAYRQAEKDMIERAWEWMTSAKGEHTFEDFRKAMEEE